MIDFALSQGPGESSPPKGQVLSNWLINGSFNFASVLLLVSGFLNGFSLMAKMHEAKMKHPSVAFIAKFFLRRLVKFVPVYFAAHLFILFL